jgi:hypothetical protein
MEKGGIGDAPAKSAAVKLPLKSRRAGAQLEKHGGEKEQVVMIDIGDASVTFSQVNVRVDGYGREKQASGLGDRWLPPAYRQWSADDVRAEFRSRPPPRE